MTDLTANLLALRAKGFVHIRLRFWDSGDDCGIEDAWASDAVGKETMLKASSYSDIEDFLWEVKNDRWEMADGGSGDLVLNLLTGDWSVEVSIKVLTEKDDFCDGCINVFQPGTLNDDPAVVVVGG